MRATFLEISSKYVAESSFRLSTKNAWAQHVRRRWPQNGLKLAQAEWDLSEGEARGLIFAQASQATIDKILDHPRGGFGLGLIILEIRCQTGLRAWVATEQKRLADAADRHAAEAARMGALARDLAVGRDLGAVRDAGLDRRASGGGGAARRRDG